MLGVSPSSLQVTCSSMVDHSISFQMSLVRSSQDICPTLATKEFKVFHLRLKHMEILPESNFTVE